MRISDIVSESKKPKFSEEFIKGMRYYINANFHQLDQKTQQRLTNIFKKEMPMLDEPMTLFRGISLDSLNELPDHSNFTKHDQIRFDGYISCSQEIDISAQFANNDFDDINIMFIIETKPGARGIIINDHDIRMPEGTENDFDVFDVDEQEVVLDVTDSVFEVVSTDLEEDSWEVRLKQL